MRRAVAAAGSLALTLASAWGVSQRVTDRPCFLPPMASPAAVASPKKDRRVAGSLALRPCLCTLHNLHTAEAVALDGTVGTAEDSLVCRLLRDRTTWEEHAMDPTNLATVRRAASTLNARRVEVVSGYRSDKLNEMLRKKGRHVARSSQHVHGRALDFRLVGVPTAELLRFVRAAHVGGVGYYPGSGFVHVDTGPVRRWSGD